MRYLRRPADCVIEDPERWLISAARYSCVDIRRKRRRDLAESLDDADPAVATADPEREALGRIAAAALLSQLPANDRAVLKALYVDGLAPRMLAAKLRIPSGRMRVMAHRARARARDAASDLRAAMGTLPWSPTLHSLVARAARRPVIWDPILGTSVAQFAALAVIAVTVGGAMPAGGAPSRLAAPAAPLPAGDRQPTGASLRTAVGGGGYPAAAGMPVVDAVASTVAPGAHGSSSGTSYSGAYASPNYQQDHTVFATGTLSLRPVIAASQDEGRTWSLLPAGGYLGGPLLFSPAYAADHLMLAAGPEFLQASTDGGRSFRTLGALPPEHGKATLMRDAGGALVVAVLTPSSLDWFELSDARLRQGPSLPAGYGAEDIAWAGTKGQVLLSGYIAGLSSQYVFVQHEKVVTCQLAGQCAVTTAIDDTNAYLYLSAPAAPEADGVVYAFGGGNIYRSSDFGATFAELSPSFPMFVWNLVVAPGSAGGHIFFTSTYGSQPQRVLEGWVTGIQLQAQTRPEPGAIASAATGLVPLPGGGLLAMLAVGGFACSADGGRSWAGAC